MPYPRKATVPAPRKGGFKVKDRRNKNEVQPINEKQTTRHTYKRKTFAVEKSGTKINLEENNKNAKGIEQPNKHITNPNYMKIKSRKKSNEVRLTGSKKEITVVTINANGRGALGLTPRFKIDLIKSYLLSSKPDTIFFQVPNRLPYFFICHSIKISVAKPCF